MDGKMREEFLVMLAVRSVQNICPERRNPLAKLAVDGRILDGS